MLAILWRILTVIGLILLALVLLLLLVLCLVLFVPIRYRADAAKTGEEIRANVKVDWLFGFFRLLLDYPDPGELSAKILCFRVFSMKLKARETEEEHKEPSENGKAAENKEGVPGASCEGQSSIVGTSVGETSVNESSAGSEAAKISSAEKTSAKREAAAGETDAIKADSVKTDSANTDTVKADTIRTNAVKTKAVESKTEKSATTMTGTTQPEDRKKEEKEQAKSGKREADDSGKAGSTGTGGKRSGGPAKEILGKVSFYWNILNTSETKGLLRHAFYRLGRILRSIAPRRLSGHIRFGTGEPDTTGYALALCYMVLPFTGNLFEMTPDFEEKVLEGEVSIRGHIVIAVLLFHAIRILLDRRLRWLIRSLKREEE